MSGIDGVRGDGYACVFFTNVVRAQDGSETPIKSRYIVLRENFLFYYKARALAPCV